MNDYTEHLNKIADLLESAKKSNVKKDDVTLKYKLGKLQYTCATLKSMIENEADLERHLGFTGGEED